MSRQKIESNISDATIEPEPIRKKSSSGSRSQTPAQPQKFLAIPPSLPPTSHRSVTPPESPHIPQREKETDTPSMNFGFDDLLDNRKLKPTNDNNDNASIGGDSQSTIKQAGGNDYGSEPNSPDYRSFKPSSQDPPESPFPTTFQKDRERRKMERGGSGGGGSDSPSQSAPVYQEPSRYINDEDEKMDLLLKLKALEERGKITLSKHYTLKSSIDDIRMEYRNQTSILETQSSINFMRKALIFSTSAVEYMNRRFDPVGAKLDGWGESVMENMMDFDGIFERLHNKYRGSMEMEPEMELLLTLGGAAFQFHLSQTFFKNAIPQFGHVLRENPDVVKGFVNVAQEAVRRNGGMNSAPRQPMPANEMGGGMQSPGIDFGALLGQVGITSGVLSDFAKTMGNPPPVAQATRDFQEPPVNDLYRQMVQQQQREDDALSVSSETSERSIGKHSKKAIISPLPTSKRGGGGNIIKLL